MGPIKTKYIRYKRIIRHYALYVLTRDIRHWYEVEHYYYMKRFRE